MTLVSFKHELIFIKTTKTAGTSIEVDLSQRLEAEAVVTPIIPPVAGHVPRNFQDASGEQVWRNHMPAVEIRDFLGDATFRRYTKFCVERDPVSKCISHFHMLRNSPDHYQPWADSWESYCNKGSFPVDVDKYTSGQDLLVDHVLRYDRLRDELPALLATLGISDFELTSRSKSNYARPVHVTPDQVTPIQRDKILRAFSKTQEVVGLDWSGAG